MTTYKQLGRSPHSPRDLSSTQTYITKKGAHSKLKENKDLDIGDCRISKHELDQGRSPEFDKNSDSYYSDDYDSTTYGSDQSPTPCSESRSPQLKKVVHKMRSVTPVKNRGLRKVGSKFSTIKWGAHSDSLNKEYSPKDIDLVTKRVLSARLLKINELRNELSEHHTKLKELQDENRILKRLQFRQEKALTKFEDTENEISHLISRHNNEIRILRERLRKSQEKERNTEKRLKDAEDELYRTNNTLKKLKQLSADKHLGEREELTKKLNILESKLDERERRVKDLEKNAELTQSSFQRQLLSENKRAHNALEENKVLHEEIRKLTQKLKEKERELYSKNIYAYRLSKPSLKKDSEVTPRNKVTNQSINIAVQTNESSLLLDLFPSSLPPFLQENAIKTMQDGALSMKQKSLEKLLIEESDRLNEKETASQKRQQEENQKKEREQKIIEDKSQKLSEEWENEQSERMENEGDAFSKNNIENKNDMHNTEEDRLKKELLLAKMFEIDKENETTIYFDTSEGPSQTQSLNSPLKTDTTEPIRNTSKYSEPSQKLFNGLAMQGSHEAFSKTQVSNHRSDNQIDSSFDLSFGSYAPSFGKGRLSGPNLNKEVSEETKIGNSKLDIKKDKKSTLMEQLFGSGSSAVLPSISTQSNSRFKNDSGGFLPWDKHGEIKLKNIISADKNSGNFYEQHTHHSEGRPGVKVVKSLEDEIEEVVLR
ncbi:hypothetical protein GDO86_009852 [Hymenochirus boettgeri]|uniref:Lebercilin domain-containing protein n=1 Tax=Hymenochirus boettgeri TaxID=247094 RepID=A0A8T2JNE5_9PIPI|nr:hypothetical protein GDO86_009852 [Hymenochirus boettgeri]